VPLAGIGPATSPLPRECSTTEPQGPRKPASRPTWNIQNPTSTGHGAGDGNRTRVISLEGWGSTIELLPPNSPHPDNSPPQGDQSLDAKSHRLHVTSIAGGGGWIRTSVRVSGQIYSLLPLTTRPPLHSAARDYATLFARRASVAASPCITRQWGNGLAGSARRWSG
jgi:hypothetical protein